MAFVNAIISVMEPVGHPTRLAVYPSALVFAHDSGVVPPPPP